MWACWSMLPASRVLAERLARADDRRPMPPDADDRRWPWSPPGVVRPTLSRSVWRSGRRHSGAGRIADARDHALSDAPRVTRASSITKPVRRRPRRSSGSKPTTASIPSSGRRCSICFLWAAAYVAHARPGMNRFISRPPDLSASRGGDFVRRQKALRPGGRAGHRSNSVSRSKRPRFPTASRRIAAGSRRGLPRAAAGRRSRNGVGHAAASISAADRLCGAIAFSTTAICCPANSSQTTHSTQPCLSPISGSLGLDSASHHLYEHGTCSLFAALGCRRKRSWRRPTAARKRGSCGRCAGRWTSGSSTGFTAPACLRLLKSILENPADFVPAEPRRGGEV